MCLELNGKVLTQHLYGPVLPSGITVIITLTLVRAWANTAFGTANFTLGCIWKHAQFCYAVRSLSSPLAM